MMAGRIKTLGYTQQVRLGRDVPPGFFQHGSIKFGRHRQHHAVRAGQGFRGIRFQHKFPGQGNPGEKFPVLPAAPHCVEIRSEGAP